MSYKVESIEFVKCRADKDGDGRLSEEELKQVKRKLVDFLFKFLGNLVNCVMFSFSFCSSHSL